mgnify:CR=1 FL=1
MNLFEIDARLNNCFVIDENVVDIETGEIFDKYYLDQLEMMKEEKIENIAKWIKNLDSDIEQLKKQKDAFATRQKVAENKRDSLKNYLSMFLNYQKWDAKDKSVSVSFRKSEAVKIVDESVIPRKWFIKQEPKLDKAGIKAALKLNTKVRGAELETKQNIQIK